VFVHGDAAALPFVDGSFDALCCFAALHLFADPFESLDEFARVLKKGGRIAIMTSVMKLFEQDEVVNALRARGFVEVHQRLSGMVQFVGGTLRG
jgi:ubiquinone/menaquinone biosynthesis C-methylase UbiE